MTGIIVTSCSYILSGSTFGAQRDDGGADDGVQSSYIFERIDTYFTGRSPKTKKVNEIC